MKARGYRHNFGNDWNEVVNTWCLGQPLSIPDKSAWEAMDVLERFWPEYLGQILSRGIRGWPIMLEAIDIGLALATCQELRGFEGVVKRIRGGDKDVLSEVRFAAFLVDLGYNPVLDEGCRQGKPDALIISEGKEIFIDVVFPHLSDEMTKAYAAMQKVARALLEKLSHRATDVVLNVYCLASSPSDILNAVAYFLDNQIRTPGETVHELPGIARIKYSNKADNLDSTFTPPDMPSPILLCTVGNQTNNEVCVRFPLADKRLRRIINDKMKQLSPEEINLLAIDTTQVPNGFQGWQPFLRRYLQPTRNKRLSGVMLYQWHWHGTGRPLLECHLEQHPNSYKQLPASFILALCPEYQQ